MNRDEFQGKNDQLKGKIKQAAGDLTDDDRLHDEGVADEAAGKVQEGFGRGRRQGGATARSPGRHPEALKPRDGAGLSALSVPSVREAPPLVEEIVETEGHLID